MIAAYVSAAFYETVAARHDADLVINAERTSPPDSAATSMEALRIGQHRESV